jgi:hypothetical protein
MTFIDEFFKTRFGIDVNHEIEEIMKRESLLHTINLLTAISQGKTIQQAASHTGTWINVDLMLDYPYSLVLTHPEQFRVKPEPKYRQWKLEEIPVGAIARRKSTCGARIPQVILGADIVSSRDREQIPYAVMHFEREDGHTATRTCSLLEHWEWKWAHEDDSCWHPCGAVERS